MRRRIFGGSHVVFLAFSLVGCAGHSSDDGPASAKSELSTTPSSSSSLDAAEVARRKNAIRAYYNDRVTALHAVATTHSSRGTTFDWIVPDKPLEAPPPPLPPCTKNCATGELQDEPQARGPSGTVPVVRFDVESYLATVKVPPQNPADVLGGVTHAEVVGPPFTDFMGYNHAGWQFQVTNYGAGAALNSWLTFPNPVDNASSHTLVEVLISGGSGSGTQSIEIGLMESVPLNRSVFPAFFTFFTTNDYGAIGDYICGYNATVAGWVQYASDFAPGNFVSISADGGAQYEVQVETERNSTAYWVGVNGEWIGYYPATLFASTGLRNSGNNVEFYGEVQGPFNQFHTPATGMGSGKFPSAGYTHAAYIRDMHYYTNASGTWSGVNPATGTHGAEDPSCYQEGNIGTDYSCNPHCGYTTSWNWFYYGGPGFGGACM